jgi:hypothetical protein
MMRIALLPSTYAVCRLPAAAPVPAWPSGDFVSISEDRGIPDRVPAERGWRCFAVEGPIPFETVGLAAKITHALAAAGVSVFFVSTWDTDYVLVPARSVDCSIAALRGAGFDL